MRTRDALCRFLEERGLADDWVSAEERLEDRWFRMRVHGRLVPLFPMWGLRRALIAHDAHHVLTGYDTSLRGEVCLAGWELGSGGCSWNVLFWIDRWVAAALGLAFAPRDVRRAFRRGRGRRNLYRLPRTAILDSDLDELRAHVRGDRGELDERRSAEHEKTTSEYL